MSETRRLCGVPSEREECCRVDSQGYTLGWYAMPLQGMEFETGLGHGIGHGIGNGSTLRQNEIETDKKTFGETFGAATGVSDPSYRKSRDKTTTRRPSRRCSRVRRPRFPQLAPRPHPSSAGYERVHSNPARSNRTQKHVRRNVR
jgi:hypothetical protein